MSAQPQAFLGEELGRLDAGGSASASAQAPSLLPTLLNVIFSLALVVALVYLAYWLLLRWRNRQGLSADAGAGKAGLIKVLERHYVDGQRAVAVVEIGDEILTLGLGQDVTLLGRIDDPQQVEALKARAPLPPTFMGFKEQLERVGMRLKRDEWSQAKQTIKTQTDALKEQMQRLRKDQEGGER